MWTSGRAQANVGLLLAAARMPTQPMNGVGLPLRTSPRPLDQHGTVAKPVIVAYRNGAPVKIVDIARIKGLTKT
jgi:hypothetical protein